MLYTQCKDLGGDVGLQISPIRLMLPLGLRLSSLAWLVGYSLLMCVCRLTSISGPCEGRDSDFGRQYEDGACRPLYRFFSWRCSGNAYPPAYNCKHVAGHNSDVTGSMDLSSGPVASSGVG